MSHVVVCAVCLLAATAQEAGGARQAARITPVVFPAHAEDPAGQNLALGIADLAGNALFATRHTNHLHLKQVFSMARSHHLTSAQLATRGPAERGARALGATCGAFGTLQRDGDGWRLEVTVFDLASGKTENRTVELPGETSAAVERGGRAVAALLAAQQGLELNRLAKLHPATESDQAMESYLACYRIIVNQSMGLRKAHVIRPALLQRARRTCRQAVEADPSFAAGWAAMSLVHSLSFDRDGAARYLRRAEKAGGYLALACMARYWWTTRFEGSEQGANCLREIIARYPGALLPLGYLGEHLNITGAYQEALRAWDQYLALVPGNPHAMAQKGYALARLGELDASIAITRKAVERDQDNMTLQLELASRLVDARKLAEAERVLAPLAEDPRVFGEVLLRLGYVHLLQKNDAEAEKLFRRALQLATGPHEWRTRGRTRYDLAIVMARRGNADEAERQLLEAEREGFAVGTLLRDHPDLQPLASRPALRKLFEHPAPRRGMLLHTTPFPVDPGGDLQPKAERKPPPMTGIEF